MKTTPSKAGKGLGHSVLSRLLWTVELLQGGLQAVANALRFKLAVRYQFKWRPDDIYIATFPKSGTTLVQMILYQLTTEGRMDFPHIDAVAPWIEARFLKGGHRQLEALPSPRVFKTHLPFHRVPQGARCIYVLRDLPAVAVSAYHHVRMMNGQVPLDRFIRRFAAGKTSIGSWGEHTASWWPHRHDPDVLFLTFEELVKDLEGTVRRIAEFCAIELDEARLPEILDRCSLSSMRAHQEKFDPRFAGNLDGPERFIRQGSVAGWREEVTSEQRELLEQAQAAVAAKLGWSETRPRPALDVGRGTSS